MRKKEVCERLARWFAEMEGRKREREREEREKNGGFLPFTDAGYASQQRNPRAACWEKLLNPGLTTSNVFRRAKSERFLSLCSWRNYRCRFRLSGKLTGATTRDHDEYEERRTKIGRKEQDRVGRRIGDEHGGRRPTILSSRFKTHTALVSCAHKSCACLGRPG